MKDRVRMIMDHFEMKQKDFANELCVAEATISNVYKGKTQVTNNLVQAIHQAFPGININWLMFGEGEMLLPLPDGGGKAGAMGAAGGSSAASGTSFGAAEAIGQNVGFSDFDEPSLFSTPSAQMGAPQSASAPNAQAYRTPQVELQLMETLTQLKNATMAEKPVRKIKEIRVFFDDGTFEAFAPLNK